MIFDTWTACFPNFKVVPDSVSASETNVIDDVPATGAVPCRAGTNRGASKVDSAARSCHWDDRG